ncbi:MAG: M28 family metallopeptidase [Armatimonadetes bacterium]|nr:M28 family metallopeptidase [Armatimonadota bacterium]
MYGFSLAAAAVLAAVALFTLGSPQTPGLAREPLSFDGNRAMDDIRTLATDYAERVAGSEQDGRCTLWLIDQLKDAGLEASIESFPAERGGRDVGLQNVYAYDRGKARGTIVLVANRDVVRSTTQGANDNASGVATLLELARCFALTSPRHTLLFLWTDGDAEGGLGAANFVARHDLDDVLAVVAVRAVATDKPTGVQVSGWSSSPRIAPPWLWLMTTPAARSAGAPEALLPHVGSQLLRLAAPLSGGLQAPFVAAGVPAVKLTAVGPAVPPPADTLETISGPTLTKIGTMVQRIVMTIDAGKPPSDASGGTVFLTRSRTLPGASLALILAAFMLPLAAVTIDLYAHCRRERVALRPAWVRAVLGITPWLTLIALAYLTNLVGLLPSGPGGVLAPWAELAARPRYLRIALLVIAFIFVALYVTAVELRMTRRARTDGRALVLVAHTSLLLISLGLALLNVYSLLLLLPAALAWPLARPGHWARSILPVVFGLSLLAAAAIHCAVQSGLGFDAWWYLFVLFETRELPVPAALLGAAFLSTTILYARSLRWAPAAASGPAAEVAPNAHAAALHGD